MRRYCDGKSSLPLISGVMPTRNRSRFARKAIEYWTRQTYPNKELVVVDDGRTPISIPKSPTASITYIKLSQPASLGEKLNIGVAAASGDYIQKIDDDDCYRADFLEKMYAALQSSEKGIVCLDSFLVYLSMDNKLVFSGGGWRTGASLFFRRSVWERRPFRPVTVAEDQYFLDDHKDWVSSVSDPELLIVVRHFGNHTWTTAAHISVEHYFGRMPQYPRPLACLLNQSDMAFYKSLAEVCINPEERQNLTGLQPTPYSVRCAPASRRG